MDINRNNYEAYFLDYHEQQLSPEQVVELMVFLEMNPDLQEALDAYESVVFEPDEFPSLPGKDRLKRKIYLPVAGIKSLNYEQWMVASIEGDLESQEQSNFNDFLELNPDARLELAIFNKTKMQAGNEVFAEKEKLRKRSMILFLRTPALTALAVAASLLLLFGVYRLIDQSSSIKNNSQRISGNHFSLAPRDVLQFAVLSHSVPTKIKKRTSLKDASIIIINPGIIAESMATPLQNMSSISGSNQIITPNIEPGFIMSSNNFIGSTTELAVNIETTDQNKSFLNRFVAGAFGRILNNSPKLNKSFIEYTIEGYNLMADREVELEKQYDDQGNVVAYHLDGELINLGRKVPAGGKE